MSAASGLGWSHEDGLSMLSLQPPCQSSSHRSFYYRAADVKAPIRLQLYGLVSPVLLTG